jgi:exodeoxyribonuclease V beta subunit
MKTFNVLDRSLNIHRNYLLEASAGTGKTFSIENVVVRLLLETPANTPELDPLTLDKILVVTFTRAATRDLKIRIRANIEKTLSYFEDACQNPSTDTSAERWPNAPDYLLFHLEQEQDSIIQGKKRLERALFCFDQAQIFTIHGFCARMLRENVFEGGVGFEIDEESTIADGQILTIIRDFFRTALTATSFSPIQLKIVSNAYQNSTEKLEQAILTTLKRGRDIKESACFSTLFQRFKDGMRQLKNEFTPSPQHILADFLKQAPCYEKLCDRQQQVKQENIDKVQFFADLFAQEEWTVKDFEDLLPEGIFLCTALDPARLKAKKTPPSPSDLHYPALVARLRELLLPIVEEAGSELYILSRMAQGCQKMLKKVCIEEEKLSFDDILKTMYQALDNPLFVERVRTLYKAAIIDEFQDTDPIQWEIFRMLFMPQEQNWGHLYLVGDPKQSIYAFRQADVYTYLSAAQLLGADHHASLDTNFRSQPSLVEALNSLYSQEASPGLMPLPRSGQILEYRKVNACETIPERKFSDPFGSIHFSIAHSDGKKLLPMETLEERYYLPYFVKEIQRLHQSDGVRFNQFAFLVKDRFQAERIATFLKKHNIPALLQRSTSLTDSPALPALRELVQAVLHPRQDSALKIALGGRIIGWTHHEILSLKDESILAKILVQFYALRKQLVSHGFSSFFENLLQSCWHDDNQTVAQRLLIQHDGADFYHDLQQIAHLAIEQEHLQHTSPDTLLAFFDHFDTHAEDRLKKRLDNTKDNVNILTLHSSKGLEFDIVIAIGLAARTKSPEQLMPLECGQLGVVLDKQAQIYRRHCEESDAEKIRQLYVAMTRAKYRLYVPVATSSECEIPELGCASPMELFLARLGQQAEAAIENMYNRIGGYDGSILCNFIDQAASQGNISYAHLKETQDLETFHFVDEIAPTLVVPETVCIPAQRQYLHSYTTLSQGSPQQVQYTALSMPHDFEAFIKTAHTLPAGSETGNLLHRILESIPFQLDEKFSHAEQLIPFVRPYLKDTPFDAWETVICKMLFNTINTPLIDGKNSFCLADIPLGQRFHEIEFLYPSEGLPELEELARFPGFLKGFIDLFFAYEGKYYLIDWKSNWLGDDDIGYGQEMLAKAMHDNNYLLQANIYAAALKRYLRLVDKRPFDEIFGGVFYVFLRGVGVFKV